MPTDLARTTRRHVRRAVLSTVMLIVVAWVFLFRPAEDHAVAWGMLAGFSGGMVAVAIASWRSRHHADSLTVGERLAAGIDDERDRAIKQQAWAFSGQASLVYAAATCLALMFGARPGLVSAVLLWATMATFYLAFIVIARRS